MSVTTGTLIDWTYEQKCQKAVQALGRKGFTAIYCKTKQEAVDYILKEAAEADTIGFGGSFSVADLKVAGALRGMGKELLIHGLPELSPEERLAIMRRQLTCDLFLTGTNALTLTGCLVNIDATGNRVASMVFGPKKVIIVAGRNKLVEDEEEAIKRIKAHAAPPNARRLNCKTPCAETGFCADCNSPDRICRIITIMERKPRLSDVRVLVVNEDMGL
ncbi:lactate utilization protein [Desulfofundulus thermobenzoicus]|uniref:Lactate utilization protein n=1 Tax=Desulfofundulus thermobenzoicus TaxID=29376 RepID=A0A6N7IQD9_9FIRM|nr:lactate utilization protein [Desulfofundulus thermobenzoicus]MQL52242.1 lactate utilization protein [Desulfofundulus thermobenzoicus]